MDLGGKKLTLDIASDMCIHESNPAVQNLYTYSEEVKQMYDKVASKWDSDEFDLCPTHDNARSVLICLTAAIRKSNTEPQFTTNSPANCNVVTNTPDKYSDITTNTPESFNAITQKHTGKVQRY